MFKKNHLLVNFPVLCLIFLLSACGKEEAADNTQQKAQVPVITTDDKAATDVTKNMATNVATSKTENTEVALVDNIKAKVEVEEKTKDIGKDTVEEISWDKLIPENYDPSTIIDKYSEQLENLRDEDPKAMELYGKIQAELDNAPVNMSLDGKTIKMPGFIAPLENDNGVINEFLLVPYFGACIHVPAPPVNQTVMIKVKKGQGVKSEDSSLPVWITGQLKAVEERTSIGAAGYRIENAKVEPYEEDEG